MNTQESSKATWTPLVDVLEDSTGITLYADLPGVTHEHLAVQVHGEQLAIEASAQLPAPQGAVRFQRRFALAKSLDTANLSAELRQGVLRVRIPKAAQAVPRRVSVAVG